MPPSPTPDPTVRLRPRLASLARARLSLPTGPRGPGDLLAPARRRPHRRIRRPRRVATVVIAAVVVAATVTAGDDDDGRRGVGQGAVVVRAPVIAGQVVGHDAVERRPVPDDLRPDGAATDPSQVVGRTAAVDLAVGEVVRADRLAPDEAPGVAGALTPGRRALPVALPMPVPGLEAGQRVDLVAAEPATGRATTVAEAATVLEVTDDVVLVSVDAADVAAVAGAVTAGPVAVAIVGAVP